MVLLSPRFAIIAGLGYLTVMSLPSPADAAAVSAQHPVSIFDVPSNGSAAGSSKKSHLATPISLPPNAMKATSDTKGKGKRTKKNFKKGKKSKSHHKGEKRSVVISDKNGASYMVPQSRRRVLVDGCQSNQRRDQEGVPGTVNIMSPMPDEPMGKSIASLLMEPNTASNSSSPFVLNASGTNQSVLYMVAVPSTDLNPNTHVTLQSLLFDPQQAAMVPYCATFDPNPPEPAPLTMESCFDENSIDSPHKSQMFAYNPDSGVLRPMWFNGEDDGKTDEQDQDPTMPSTANVASVTSMNGTDSAGNSTDNANSTLATRGQGSAGTPAQNVTLVFTPFSPEVSSLPNVDALSDSTNSSAITSTVTMTTSSTETMTTTVTTSMVAALDVTSSAVPTTSGSVALSTSSAVPTTSDSTAPSTSSADAKLNAMSVATTSSESASVVSSTSSSQGTSSSSSSSPSSSPASTSSASELDVEVAGPSTTTSAISSSSQSSGAPASTSSAVNAEAIASSIAASASSASASDSSSMSAESASTSSAATSTSTLLAAAAVDASSTGASSTMTPVSTAPYEWMFKPDTRL